MMQVAVACGASQDTTARIMQGTSDAQTSEFSGDQANTQPVPESPTDSGLTVEVLDDDSSIDTDQSQGQGSIVIDAAASIGDDRHMDASTASQPLDATNAQSSDEPAGGQNLQLADESPEPITGSESDADKVELKIEVLDSIDKIKKEEWDELATASGEVNPFLLWSFFHALESSGSAVSQGFCSRAAGTWGRVAERVWLYMNFDQS